jgi:hypothetical protein
MRLITITFCTCMNTKLYLIQLQNGFLELQRIHRKYNFQYF